MSWFSPLLAIRDDFGASSASAPRVGTTKHVAAAPGLGSASASGAWSWASSPAVAPDVALASAAPRPASAGSAVRAPIELLARMTEAARAQGRSESDVWVEAAREWLRGREGAPNTPPAAPACLAAPVAPPRRHARVWDEIDSLLSELRAPATGACESVPAA